MKKVLLLPLLWGITFQSFGQDVDSSKSERPLPTYTEGFALGLKAGTAGFGLDLYHSINRHFTGRIGFGLFNYKTRFISGSSTDDVQIGLDGNIKIKTVNALIDYYPFKRMGFRLTGGIMLNLNEVTLDGKPTRDVKLEDLTFTVDEIGTLSGKAEFNKLAPYIGLGFGQPFLRNRLKFNIDLGFFYQQSPKVSLTATKMLEPSQDQAAIIERNLKPLKYYPVLNLGVSYRLNK
ncbi:MULTISPECIES: hypothetical protein [unclassified Siphonobacter]|uniref:hypothetical protein n=1 Tax=unclassified Siphonobacter TaxID=2635712 RepID=UPI000CB20E79|nr:MULTISPECIES: hypothetical protein [unclassified Siphonobacter]MDQ1086490.1 hypothetical protein [Siphonobacter sp. SORGH_AS_1065]MDR6196762.1 hypothetical protein [Siphonobacter sp. SORGH_AS_0500]PKK36075.1 hypothetical protein BWI96_13745 [Siphonobacter sp. SORGH_AS_0500]